VSVIGLSNNLNKTGFSQDELNSMGGFNRSGGNQAWDGTFGGNGWGGMERVISSGLNINNDYGEKLKMNLAYFYTKSDQTYDSKSYSEQTLPETILKSTSNYNTLQNSQKHNITGLIEWVPDTIKRFKYEPKLNFNPSGDITSSSENSSNTLTPRLTESINNSHSSGFNNTFSHEFSFYTKLKRKDESFRLAHTLSLNKSGSTEFDYNNLISYTTAIQSQILDRLGDNNKHDNSAGISETYNRRFSKKTSAELFSNSRYLTTLEQVSLYNKNTASGSYDQFLPDQSNKLLRYWFVQNLRPQVSYQFNDKLTARAGLNGEFQYINNQFNSTVPNIAKHYLFFFPEFELSGDGYSLNYSESIDQPAIYQLQPITRIYNQLYKSTGNPNLDPSRVHSIYARYYKYNYDKQVNFNLYSSFTLTDNKVVERTTRDTIGAITQTYVNRNGGWRGYFGGNWGKQFKKTQQWQIGLSTNFSGNIDNGSFFFNGDEGTRSNYSFNLKQNINFNYNSTISFNTNYNINENITRYGQVNYPAVNTLKHTIGTDITVRWPARMIFDAKYNYSYNPQIAQGFPRSSNIVDLAVTFLMFKKDRGQLKLSVFDLLDQSVSIYRYAYINSLTTGEQQILQRYFMLTTSIN
jgi:hypothetical protein